MMTDQNPFQVAANANVECDSLMDSTQIGSADMVRRQDVNVVAIDEKPLVAANSSLRASARSFFQHKKVYLDNRQRDSRLMHKPSEKCKRFETSDVNAMIEDS